MYLKLRVIPSIAIKTLNKHQTAKLTPGLLPKYKLQIAQEIKNFVYFQLRFIVFLDKKFVGALLIFLSFCQRLLFLYIDRFNLLQLSKIMTTEFVLLFEKIML